MANTNIAKKSLEYLNRASFFMSAGFGAIAFGIACAALFYTVESFRTPSFTIGTIFLCAVGLVWFYGALRNFYLYVIHGPHFSKKPKLPILEAIVLGLKIVFGFDEI
jgi:ABC-type Fe3+-siderophore transport system permease subunit